ncbi:MAG: molybdenum cofactor guanylyltransferase [Pseudomonadota bacterium]
MSRILGAILAGGSARRFGSDKALAHWHGKRLIDWVAEALDAQCESVALCGREEPGFQCLADMPEAGLGPLGGLNAALSHAAVNGFTHTMSAGVDAPNLPHSLGWALGGEGAAIVESQPVIGLWPVAVAGDLSAFLRQGGRSLYGFAERINARRVTLDIALMNVNQPGDLAG